MGFTGSRAISHSPQQLSKRWHAEPPPVLQSACLAVDKKNGRTYIIGYDSKKVLTFNFIDSTEACDSVQEEKNHADNGDEDEWQEGFDWRHAQWISLPYPGGAAHQGRRFDTEHCFLSSDRKFIVPSYERDGEGGFSVWDHDARTWTHVRLDRECSCHEESVERGSKIKIKTDSKKIRFEYPNQIAVVYQSYRKEAPIHDHFPAGAEEAIDTVVIHWRDANERDHLTGVQLVNHQVYSCHDIKVARDVLPKDLTLMASPVNPDHYTHEKHPKKYKHKGDHGSRCDSTTLFLFGPHGSGWFDISIADRPSPRPVDIVYREHKGHENRDRGGFHHLPKLEVEHPRSVHYGGQLWIFGKNDKGVGVWSIDTSASDHGYEIVPQSQGGPTPGSLACASCGDGIIVYGSCDRSEDCSTNLRHGEQGNLGGSAPVSIFRPGTRGGDDNDDEDDDEDEGENENGENGGGNNGEGGNNGGSDTGGAGIGGSTTGGNGNGNGGNGNGGTGGNGSNSSGGTGGNGSNGSGGTGGNGSNGSGGTGGNGDSGSGSTGGNGDSGSSGASGNGDSGSSGTGGNGDSGSSGTGGNGDSGSGSTGGNGDSGSSGSSGTGGAGSTGSGGSTSGGGGSWSPDSGIPSDTVPNGVPGATVPGSPIANPDAGGQVLVGGANQTATPTATITATASIGTVPTIPVPGGLPGGAKTSDDGSKSNVAPILAAIFGFLFLVALVAFLFMFAKRRRERRDDDESIDETGAFSPGDDNYGGGGMAGSGGTFAGPGTTGPFKNTPGVPGGGIPPLAPAGPSGSGGPSAPGGPTDGGSPTAPDGPSSSTRPSDSANGTADGRIPNKHKRKESLNPKDQRQEQVFEADHAAHGDSSNESANNNVLNAKRTSKAKFFMGGGDYKPPLRRPSPGLPESSNPTKLPITTAGPKTEVVDDTLESVQVVPKEEHVVTGGKNTTTTVHTNSGTSSSTTGNHKGAIISGATGVALATGAIAAAHHSNKDTKNTTTKVTSNNGGKTTTTTTVTGSSSGPHVTHGETQEVLHDNVGGTISGHGRFESTTSSGMNISGPSSVMYQSGSTSTTSVGSMHVVDNKQTVTIDGKTTTVTSSSSTEPFVGGMIDAGAVPDVLTQQQRPQGPPTIHKTQITLKLSIIRYERSDASQATPNAKPGTLMFSQVEMLDGAPDVRIPGSAFSHVRDSSKVTGQEENLPSPIVPGPTGAARSTESEPRERSLRWMTNEFKWKREAGMLQHLRSDVHIAELFTLYSLPSFAEYRYVSVMGPFTRTLDTYIKERRGIRTTPPSQPLTPEQVSLTALGPLSLDDIKGLTDSIGSALKWCHDHHVVHLSLSPASIFLQEYYTESDGQGGFRQSVYSNYSRSSTVTDAETPKIVQQWKLWDFSHARFVGEAVDLTMDMTGYTSPEILIASRRHSQKTTSTTNLENPNQDSTMTTTVGSDGKVTKTTTIKSSSLESTTTSTVTKSQEQEKLMAAQTMDMWSFGQIVYEMHTTQSMFTSAEDALIKLTSALEKPEGEDDGDDDGNDLDKAEAHDKIRQQLQDQIQKIEQIPERGAREVITGLLEMRQERRLDHDEVRTLYLDLQE
ncbi:hypothetical protein BGX23_008775 [Mortierella sp. AD031]|nr:hypothetical protein BGX23_008775 [Mortierella sp. AD031]